MTFIDGRLWAQAHMRLQREDQNVIHTLSNEARDNGHEVVATWLDSLLTCGS
jgi:hypothetical protein